MLNNCYTLHQSPVFRNPKSNIAVQQLTTYINNTQGRISPLHPSVKKIIGIKKNSSTDNQSPLCEVPFQTNIFAQQEITNDLSYSNRSNLQSNRFSRNQRTHSVYTVNKENYVKSPTRSPFSKPIIQRDCLTPIYSKSPIQRVQSPGISTIMRQTNQRGCGAISPLRLQQRNNIIYKEPQPQLSEMVDNLKQNILRDIQEVTKKYTNHNCQMNSQKQCQRMQNQNENIKQQDIKKQLYIEQQTQVLQQQLEFIKNQQSKFSGQQRINFCSQEGQQTNTKDFKILPSGKLKETKWTLNQQQALPLKNGSLNSNSNNFQVQSENDKPPFLNPTKMNKQIPNFSKIEYHQNHKMNSEQENYCQNYNDNTHKRQENLFMSPTALNVDQYTKKISNSKYCSPFNFAGQSNNSNSTNTNTNTFSSQSELIKLKNLQLELMQNKPLFEQPISSKIDLHFIKQPDETAKTNRQEFELEKRKSLTNFNNHYDLCNQEKKNILDAVKKSSQVHLAAYLQPFSKMLDDVDEDENNQATISNLSSIIPAEVSANQNKKINVSFESSLEQPQFDDFKASDCRNTFGPLQLEIILKSPASEYVQPQQVHQNEVPTIKDLFVKQAHNNQRLFNENFESEISERQKSIPKLNMNSQGLEKIDKRQFVEQSYIEIETNQSPAHSESPEAIVSNTYLENSIKQFEDQFSRSPKKEKSSIIQKLNPEGQVDRKISNSSDVSSTKQHRNVLSTQKDKGSSHQSQRYEDAQGERLIEPLEIQEFSSNHSSRYEQILQNFQNLKNQSRIEFCETQPIQQSMQVQDCLHISDFVVFCEKKDENNQEGAKKKTVTFNQQLIQQPNENQSYKPTSFSDFMKNKAADTFSQEQQQAIQLESLATQEPRIGISFLQYKQQLEN